MSNSSFFHDGRIRQVLNEAKVDIDDPEPANKPSSQDEEEAVFLQVIDAPFDGTTPQIRARFTADQNIKDGMRSILEHDPKTARIFDVTVHSDFLITGLRDTKGPEKTREARVGLIEFLQETYKTPFDPRRTFRWLNDPLLVNDIGSISSQWSQHLGDKKTHFYRLVNRTSLQQDPLDFDLHPRDSYLTCAQDGSGRLIIIIVHDVWSRQRFFTNTASEGHPFENPRSISSIISETSWTSFSDGTLDTFAKLSVLDFFVESIYLQPVDYYEKLIYPQYSESEDKDVLKISLTKNPHLQVPLGLFEPRLSAKSREAFREIKDAEGILRSVNNLVDSIDCVIAALRSDDAVITKRQKKKKRQWQRQQPRHKDYVRRMRELKGLCAERRSNAQRALEALNRQLDYLTKGHAIREAKAIKILTILASLYLPLSLSASLLGMQSPFKYIAHDRTPADDDGDGSARLVGTNLLFDFFGVFIVLGTTTVFIVYSIRLALYIHATGGYNILPKHFNGPFSIVDYGKSWRFGGKGGKCFDYLRVITRWIIGGGFGVVLLVIFLMGMLRNAQVAWNTARYWFAAYTSLSAALLLACAGLYSALYHRKLGGRWSEAFRPSVLGPPS